MSVEHCGTWDELIPATLPLARRMFDRGANLASLRHDPLPLTVRRRSVKIEAHNDPVGRKRHSASDLARGLHASRLESIKPGSHLFSYLHFGIVTTETDVVGCSGVLLLHACFGEDALNFQQRQCQVGIGP